VKIRGACCHAARTTETSAGGFDAGDADDRDFVVGDLVQHPVAADTQSAYIG
jgi:hypothetical protein